MPEATGKTKRRSRAGRKKKPANLKLHPVTVTLPRDVIEGMKYFDPNEMGSASRAIRWLVFNFLADRQPSPKQTSIYSSFIPPSVLTLVARIGEDMRAFESAVEGRKAERAVRKRLGKYKGSVREKHVAARAAERKADASGESPA